MLCNKIPTVTLHRLAQFCSCSCHCKTSLALERMVLLVCQNSKQAKRNIATKAAQVPKTTRCFDSLVQDLQMSKSNETTTDRSSIYVSIETCEAVIVDALVQGRAKVQTLRWGCLPTTHTIQAVALSPEGL